ncbi:MAG: hypothetical protein NUW23_02395 [Firmicutes bacterium]|jgi:hypothetical protein|nr:hypothetical protein [Bacillota bacterium]
MAAVAAENVLREFGPFAGHPEGTVTLRRLARTKPDCFIANGHQIDTLRLLSELKVLTSAQIAALRGIQPRTMKDNLRHMWLAGLVDRLETDISPCMYAVGYESARLLRLTLERFSVGSAFRLVAANQLYVAMRRLWPEVDYTAAPHDGVTAQARLGSTTYAILAPRLFPGDVVWCEEMIEYVPDDMRLLVVCASRKQAEEIARAVAPEAMARFTWDTELANGLRLYKRFAGSLEIAENYA